LWLLAAFTALLAATPITLDFVPGAPNSNIGASYLISGSPTLTITARYKLPEPSDPIFGGGLAGTIYWGDLGDMVDPTACGVTGKPAGIGLGVQKAGGGGSNGISGNGGDQNEALVFTWDGPGVPAGSIRLGLVGLNDVANKATDVDIVALYLEFWPSNGSPSDVTINPYNFAAIAAAPSIVDFSSIVPPGMDTSFVRSISVAASQGHFGVDAQSYEEVPEPASWLGAAAGLLALAGLRRARLA